MSRGHNLFNNDLLNPLGIESPSGSKNSLQRQSSKSFVIGSKNDAIVDVPLSPVIDAKKRKELAEWEENLKRREMDIKRREDMLTQAGIVIDERNWPPIYPIIHHDIAKEIPVRAQKSQYMAFCSWLGILLCLSWNLIAVFVCWTRGGGVKILFLAVIYALLGCPLSYLLWYRPLYQAMRTDNVLKFGCFFISYLVHIGFCVLATISPPIIFQGWSVTGFLAAVDTLTESAFVGMLYLIGSCMFCFETFISLLVIQKVYLYFRGHR